MTAIGFIGVGNMGGPMARNLLKAGFEVRIFDVNAEMTKPIIGAGAAAARNLREACEGADTVLTMLPAGQHVRTVYLDKEGVLASARPGTLLVDCSTVDIDSALAVHRAAGVGGVRDGPEPRRGVRVPMDRGEPRHPGGARDTGIRTLG